MKVTKNGDTLTMSLAIARELISLLEKGSEKERVKAAQYLKNHVEEYGVEVETEI